MAIILIGGESGAFIVVVAVVVVSLVVTIRCNCDDRHLIVSFVILNCTAYHPRPRSSRMIP